MNLDRAELDRHRRRARLPRRADRGDVDQPRPVANAPEPPAMEVELVDDVGLQSAAPEPPPAAAEPGSRNRRSAGDRADARARQRAPSRPHRASLRRRRARKSPLPPPRPRACRGSATISSRASPTRPPPPRPRPAAATFDARAKASVAQLIADQIRPCALEQRELGAGANRIQVTLNLQLHPQRPPEAQPDRRPRHRRRRRQRPISSTWSSTRRSPPTANARRSAFRPSSTRRPRAAGPTST